MKRIFSCGLAAGLLLACLTGCSVLQSDIPDSQEVPVSSALEAPSGQEPAPSPSSAPNGGTSSGEISREEALAIALDNAGVPEGDAYNIKNETDRDHGIPIYDIEFETEYGDYDFEIAIDGGRIVGADYEVDEEHLAALPENPISLEQAAALVQEKVPGSSASDVRLWEEGDDGRTRYEGDLLYGGIKYEFEIDPRTGRIFDWNADLRD